MTNGITLYGARGSGAVPVEAALTLLEVPYGLIDAYTWDHDDPASGDQMLEPGRYILGDDLSVLDLYVAAVSRFRPRRNRFYEVAPKMGEVVRRVDIDPRLHALWKERMGFHEGWEG